MASRRPRDSHPRRSAPAPTAEGEGKGEWTTAIDEVHMPHRGPVPLVGRLFASCEEVKRHAARDNTALYIALLPRELRDAIDGLVRAVTGLHAGALKRLDLDREGDLVRGADRLVRVVSTEGDKR